MDKRILCTLTPSELLERRQTLLASLKRNVTCVERIPSGNAYHFPPTPDMLRDVQHIVELERQCCGFLSFKIQESRERIRLEITGAEGALAIIDDFFGGVSE